jgi:hypothetical protein
VGSTIGLETWQLNRDVVYPSTNRVANALATLDHIGMFSAPLAQPPAQLPKLPDPAGTDAVDARARSYLHANCSHCHRPSGSGHDGSALRGDVQEHEDVQRRFDARAEQRRQHDLDARRSKQIDHVAARSRERH